MKIYFDNLIFSWQKSGGISIVWREIEQRMAENAMDYRVIEFPGHESSNVRKMLNIPEERTIVRNDGLQLLRRYLPLGLKEDEPFIFQATYYRTCTNPKAINIVTVHDFTYELYNKGVKKMLHSACKNRAVRSADYVVCVSENTRRDLLSFVPDIDPAKVLTIYNGVSSAYHLLSDSERTTADEPFIVFVGNRVGYKNFHIAVETAKLLDIRLLIVGGNLTEAERQMLDKEIPGNYECLGFVSENDLNTIYNKATALIYPSSYEGFGIPVIEAQKAGCPVVAMNRSSIPEIIGRHDLLVENEEAQAFAEKIQLLNDAAFRESIIKDGIANATRFSWDKCFEQYKNLYESIMSKHS